MQGLTLTPLTLLLDETEKAAPEIWDGFMSLFDDGKAKDTTSGEEVSFAKTMIFMTSNLVTAEVDGDTAREIIRESGYFRTEMVNRIEHVVPFKTLVGETKLKIVRKVMAGIVANYSTLNGENLKVSEKMVRFYADVELSDGVRDLERVYKEICTGW